MGPTLVLVRNPTAARLLLLLLLLPWHATTAKPGLLRLLLPRHATVARPVMLQLLLPWHATVARSVLLQLLLPRYATVARYHMVIPSLDSDSHGPPAPTATTDDKSMGVRWTFQELAENELNNF